MVATPSRVTLKDGTELWRVQFRTHKGGTPTSERFDTFDEALRFAHLVERVGGAQARKFLDETTLSDWFTVNDAVRAYITSTKAHARESTIRNYEHMASAYIDAEIGDIPVATLTKNDVTKWVARLRSIETVYRGQPHKLASSTVKNITVFLSMVLENQVREGKLGRNVAREVKVAKDSVSRERVFLHAEDMARILDAAPEFYRPLIMFLYGTGCRYGEAAALEVRDLDLDAPVPSVRIVKTLSGSGRHMTVSAPKTRKGIRTISLPAPLVDMLRERVVGKSGGDLVFPAHSGGYLQNSTFHNVCWQKVVRQCGFDPKPRVHDLRHSHASALIAAGIPLPVIQQRLGHESIKTTVDTYGHLAPDAAVHAAAAIAQSLQSVPVGELTAE